MEAQPHVHASVDRFHRVGIFFHFQSVVFLHDNQSSIGAISEKVFKVKSDYCCTAFAFLILILIVFHSATSTPSALVQLTVEDRMFHGRQSSGHIIQCMKTLHALYDETKKVGVA